MTFRADVRTLDEVRQALQAIKVANLTLPEEPVAENYARFLGFSAGGRRVEERTPAEVLADIGGAAAGHTHALPDLTDVTSATQTDGFVLQSTGSNYLGAQLDHGKLGGLTDTADHPYASLITGGRDYIGEVAGVFPTVSASLATKEYVDLTAGFHFDYFLTDTASSIATYFVLQDLETGEAQSSHTLAGAGSGDDQLVAAFATLANEPGIGALHAGVYDCHFHAERTVGNRTVTMYWTLSKYETDTTETLLMTSEVSAVVTAETEFDLHATLGANLVLDTTDRLVLKIYANLSATPASATTVVIYQEGDSDAHVTIGVDSSVLSNIFLRQDATKPLLADWDAGSFKITAKTLESDVATGTPPLIVASTTAVSNLNADQVDGKDASDLVLKADFNAKGDILSASANDTPLILSVGTNDFVLTAASGESTGLKWAAASGWTSLTSKLVQRDLTIFAPGLVNDIIPVMYFSDRMFPNGTTIVHLSIRTAQNSSLTALFKERDVNDADQGTVHSLSTSTSKYAEVEDGSITAPDIAANGWLYLTVPADDILFLAVCVIAKVNDS